MRTLFVSSVVLALAVISCNGLPQGGAAPTAAHPNAIARPQGVRPQRPQNMSNRLRSMLNGYMGDMSVAYDRVRKGITRTFSGGSRSNGFRNVNGGEGGVRSPVDPAIHTNEIAPARNSEGAPNAPAQGFRRPAGGRRPSAFMKRVEQLVGNMRNMFQSFNRRMSGAGNTRRTQPQPQQPAHHQPQAAEQHQTGEFRPLQ